MEISGVHQHQAMELHLDTVLSCNKSQQQQEKKPRPQPEQALKCPRCDSTNTKFCYYNNYSLSQPRYFCKGCRRYWTKGGSLRNVPVGGGCRKNNKRSSSSSNSPSSSSSTSSKKLQHQDLTNNSNPFLPPLPLPPLPFDPNDLTLAFASLQNQPTTIVENNDHFMLANPNPNSNPNTTLPFLDILRGGYVDNSPSGSFQSMYYGFGGNIGNANGNAEEVEGEGDAHMVFSLDGGLLNSSRHISSTEAVTTTATAAASTNEASGGDHGGGDNKVATGLHRWQLGLGDDNMIHANLGLDSTRDYWNGVGNLGSWRGIINSSLM